MLEAHEVQPGVLSQRTYYRFDGEVSYFSETLYTSSATYTASQWLNGDMCFFGPPLAFPHPIQVGASWSTESFCANDSVPRRQVNNRRSVSGMERLTLQGKEVNVFVIDYYTEVRQTSGDGFSNEGKSWYSEEDRLALKTTFKIANLGGGPQVTREEILISSP